MPLPTTPNTIRNMALMPGQRLLSSRLQAGRGSMIDEALAIAIFLAIPVEFTELAFLRLPLLALVLGLAVLAWRDLVPVLRRGWVFFLIPAFCLISVLWSAFTFETIRFSIFTALALVTAALMAVRLDHRQIVVALMLAKLLIAIASLLFMEQTYVGGLNGGWAILGLYPHKNVLGGHMVAMMIAAVVILLDHRYEKIWRLAALPTLGLGAFFVFNAQSATAIVLMALGCAGAATIGGVWRPAAAVRGLRTMFVAGGIFVAAAGVLALSTFSQVDPWTYALEKLGKDSSLTGRTAIWDRAEVIIDEHPVLGVGADAFWRPGVGQARQIVGMFGDSPDNHFNFHNVYYEVTVHTGYVGLTLYLTVMAIALYTLVIHWWRNQRAVDGFFIAMLAVILARSQTESEMFLFLSLSMVTLWTGVFLAIRDQVERGGKAV
ncbi:O-antigen ligase family protein [Parvularcula flava]|uniref:O-antigen ligase family protein n=1 Tax=Aquisalinus luteolus TaxID=1566827 RepID=A0A8J3AB58_9PROT|nr:O-antigen ligase family protein [Aquisalinus luteolus]NHK29479.1 O-antigen ligase family protein [Aquisalinus luteolus]GGI01820.1 hypothetical protein GCM10011355_33360 [Aquisalinus luteolus]